MNAVVNRFTEWADALNVMAKLPNLFVSYNRNIIAVRSN